MNTNNKRAGWAKYSLLLALVAACGAGGWYLAGGWSGTPGPTGTGEATQRFPLTEIDAKDTMEAPALAADSTGRVFLTWASQTGPDERTLWLTSAASGERSFRTPAALGKSGIFRTTSMSRGKTVTRDVKMMPHVAVDRQRVLLSWTETLPDLSGVRLVLATSDDAGATFGAGKPVHQGEKARPTYTALAVGPGGMLACSWLDNRAGSQQTFASVRLPEREQFEREVVVHAGQEGKGVCPCCPTASAFGPDGTLYVAFRNIQDGYRDIAVGRLRPGQSSFDGPFPVATETWKFDGCPHDGPSIAVVGELLHVAWMDARGGPQRCYHASAKLTDMKFAHQAELNPSGPGSQGNPKLFADPAGKLHVVWEESLGAEPKEAQTGHKHGAPQVHSGGGRAIQYACLNPGEEHFGQARAVTARAGAFQTRPAITGTSASLTIAWKELDESGKAVVVTRLEGQP
jgi:hypothetical protein